MSDNWITIIPRDVNCPADHKALEQARAYLHDIAEDADGLKIINDSKVRLFDCGTNLESITCHACGADIDQCWWAEQINQRMARNAEMDVLQLVRFPCCETNGTLNDLIYFFDQGFSRWGIEAMNPNIAQLPAHVVHEFERILGCTIRVVYQHL